MNKINVSGLVDYFEFNPKKIYIFEKTNQRYYSFQYPNHYIKFCIKNKVFFSIF